MNHDKPGRVPLKPRDVVPLPRGAVHLNGGHVVRLGRELRQRLGRMGVELRRGERAGIAARVERLLAEVASAPDQTEATVIFETNAGLLRRLPEEALEAVEDAFGELQA